MFDCSFAQYNWKFTSIVLLWTENGVANEKIIFSIFLSNLEISSQIPLSQWKAWLHIHRTAFSQRIKIQTVTCHQWSWQCTVPRALVSAQTGLMAHWCPAGAKGLLSRKTLCRGWPNWELCWAACSLRATGWTCLSSTARQKLVTPAGESFLSASARTKIIKSHKVNTGYHHRMQPLSAALGLLEVNLAHVASLLDIYTKVCLDFLCFLGEPDIALPKLKPIYWPSKKKHSNSMFTPLRNVSQCNTNSRILLGDKQFFF